MRIFSKLYGWMMQWSHHRHAPYYLFGVSFAESSFFPIPPDVMLAPMSLAKPDRALYYAFITTLASVLGGIFGYIIGMFFLKLVYPYIIYFGYEHTYTEIMTWLDKWDFWVMFLAGFTFIPYKIFTIAAGATSMHWAPFILGSIIGRGGRFFLVALIIKWGGRQMENVLNQYVDRIAWITIALAGLGYLIWRYVT